MSGFVYFIAPEALFSRSDMQLVKIGYTSGHPKGRLRALQCGSPVVLDVWAYIEGSEALERAFHEAFAPLRAHGEWFYIEHRLRWFLSYFDRAPVSRRIDRNAVTEALHDNVLSSSVPHPDIDAVEWKHSASIDPLLPFFPEVLEV